MLRSFFFIVCVFFSSCFGYPKLLLHFDINQTIIPLDPAGSKSIDSVLNHALSKKYFDTWDETLTSPISYYDYVFHVLFTGPRSSKELKRKRTKVLSQFVEHLQTINHRFAKEATATFNLCKEKLQKENIYIFPSFYKLLSYLEEKKFSFSLLLRTFGSEGFLVVTEIEKNTPIRFSPQRLFFKNHSLHTEASLLTNPKDIYQFFTQNHHLLIEDHWLSWNQNEEISKYGKTFPIDPKDKSVISLFFDDHIEIQKDAKHNVIAPIDIHTNKLLDVHKLAKKNTVFAINPIDAILDKDYFIKLLKEALRFL